ncbi:peptidase domain-containing ABC transporter [Magnetococcales bacterium HHB-1]
MKEISHTRRNMFDLGVAALVGNVLSLALPLTLMQVYDRILVYESFNTLGWLVFSCFLAIVLESVLRYMRGMLTGWMAARFEHNTGIHAMDRLLSSGLTSFESCGLGVHLDRMNAIQVLRNLRAGQIYQVVMDLPFAFLFIFFIALLGGDLVIVPLVVVTIFFIIFLFLRKRFVQLKANQSKIDDRRYNFLIELFSGIHLVKSLSFEDQMLHRYDSLLSSLAESNDQVTLWGQVPGNVGHLFSQVMMFGIIAMGGTLVIEGEISLGVLTACTMLGARAVQPIQSAVAFWLCLSEAEVAQKQLDALLNLPSDIPADAPTFPQDISGSVVVRELSFRYQEDLPWLIKDMTISFPARSITGIMATGAAGTTTLAYLMMGMLEPSSGAVLIDDYNIRGWDHTDLHGRVEYLPQNGVLFNGTILDNIAVFDSRRRAAALSAAALFGLDEVVANMTQGYETEVTSQSNNTLPTGLIQRIALARAFVIRPRILIFDKSNALMDQESETIFLELFERLKGKCTIIMISNHPGLLSYCDALYELIDGDLVARDHPELL